MSGSFTKGPWEASAPDGSYHDVIRIYSAAEGDGPLPVAVCPQRKSAIMEVFSGSTDETTEAARNARLIAAAPDMLEALYQYESDLLHPPTGDSLERRLERARKVIAQAIGNAATLEAAE